MQTSLTSVPNPPRTRRTPIAKITAQATVSICDLGPLLLARFGISCIYSARSRSRPFTRPRLLFLPQCCCATSNSLPAQCPVNSSDRFPRHGDYDKHLCWIYYSRLSRGQWNSDSRQQTVRDGCSSPQPLYPQHTDAGELVTHSIIRARMFGAMSGTCGWEIHVACCGFGMTATKARLMTDDQVLCSLTQVLRNALGGVALCGCRARYSMLHCVPGVDFPCGTVIGSEMARRTAIQV